MRAGGRGFWRPGGVESFAERGGRGGMAAVYLLARPDRLLYRLTQGLVGLSHIDVISTR